MSSPSRPAAPGGGVVALLVSHDGARWLPGVVEGIAEQGPLLDRVVAVDTGSRDGSRDLLPPGADVVAATSATTYPEAVGLGLERIGRDVGWVWLLHDDSRPAPGALAALLAAAARRPDADVLGPKLREWPSLLRLLELGVTISGTGRRETGLERGEYDQGQHDEQREVLAVNTAGMLVRRDLLDELGGFDPRLPMFGNDLDFGWRAAAAGRTTLIVPEAVVFHAEAAHRGLRRTPLTGRHTHYQERRAALYTLLVNSSAAGLPWRVVRLTLGTLVRVVGFLLVRSVGEALDDLAALVTVVFRPGLVRAGRRARRERAASTSAGQPDRERVERLLAPAWVPYRHGLDFVGDVAAAVTNQAADVAERRRVAAAERDPSSLAAARLRAEQQREEDDELADTGAVARFFTNPVALVLSALVVAMVLGARTAFGAVSGGALAPAPSSAGAWWSLHYESWHALGFGTDVPAPPYVLPLAVLGSAIGPTAAVSALLLLAAPFGLWGAWRFLRVAGRLVSPRGAPRWLLVGGAATYALVPVTSGVWAEGRLGLVVAHALLPWLAHAALGFADPDGDRRWRAGWRVGVLLTLVSAGAPVGWLLAAVLVVAVLAGGLLLTRATVGARDVWGPPLTAIAVPLVLLAPWWLIALVRDAGTALVLETGRLPSEPVGPLDVLTGRVGDLGAPTWLGVVLLVLAALAVAPRATRIPVTLCWLVALVATALAAALSVLRPALATGETPPGVGVLVLAVQGCLVAAAVLGAQGAARARWTPALRPLGVALALVAAVVPVTGLVWWFVGDDELTSRADAVVPAYMVQRAPGEPEHGVLVVRGDEADGLEYSVRRGEGVTLGEDEVLGLSDEDVEGTTTVRQLVSLPAPGVVARLAELGVEYVLLPAPADSEIAATLDATSGLSQASSGPGSRAWQVERPLALEAPGSGSVLRTVLLVGQGVGLVLALVLCVPTIRSGRGRRR